MKVGFELEVWFFDDRDGQHNGLEIVTLTRSCEMSHTPQIGMEVIIGKNKDDLSRHIIKEMTWVEKDDSLWVTVDKYETQVDDEENEEEEWKYFDGLIENFIEDDGWKVFRPMTRTGRENSKWSEIK